MAQKRIGTLEFSKLVGRLSATKPQAAESAVLNYAKQMDRKGVMILRSEEESFAGATKEKKHRLKGVVLEEFAKKEEKQGYTSSAIEYFMVAEDAFKTAAYYEISVTKKLDNLRKAKNCRQDQIRLRHAIAGETQQISSSTASDYVSVAGFAKSIGDLERESKMDSRASYHEAGTLYAALADFDSVRRNVFLENAISCFADAADNGSLRLIVTIAQNHDGLTYFALRALKRIASPVQTLGGEFSLGSTMDNGAALDAGKETNRFACQLVGEIHESQQKYVDAAEWYSYAGNEHEGPKRAANMLVREIERLEKEGGESNIQKADIYRTVVFALYLEGEAPDAAFKVLGIEVMEAAN